MYLTVRKMKFLLMENVNVKMDTFVLVISADINVVSMKSGKEGNVSARMGMPRLMVFVANALHTPELPLIKAPVSVISTTIGCLRPAPVRKLSAHPTQPSCTRVMTTSVFVTKVT